MPPQQSLQPLVRPLKNMFGHPVVDKWIESLRDDPLAICDRCNVPNLIPIVGSPAMPDLAIKHISTARLREETDGLLPLKCWIFFSGRPTSRIVAAGNNLCWPIVYRFNINEWDKHIDNEAGQRDAGVVSRHILR